ncbi:hypothetical protein BVC80_8715g2 [Macleaya cordata]|uniref:Uncharacterized protein n=1 Tax=Macleaya cordata TaxID=56857 RepID=A0A200QAQ7_MACCD|nr:hypothetical protein BVC80_8715g2 [Macleaya cordata]
MQDLTMQVSQGTAPYTPDEIFTKVMGDERHGRVRACGAGPTPTTYFGRQPSKDNYIQEQLDEANTKIVEQAKDIAVMKEQLRILIEQLQGQKK